MSAARVDRKARHSDQEKDVPAVLIDAVRSVTSRDTGSLYRRITANVGRIRQSDRPCVRPWSPQRFPGIVAGVTALLGALLIAAIVLLIVVQAVARHRRLTRRESSGQTTIPRSTWIVFAVAAAFLVFSVFLFPVLVKR
jgi:hypothetical protein